MPYIDINNECVIPRANFIAFLINKYPHKEFDTVADMIKYISRLPSNSTQLYFIRRVKISNGLQLPFNFLENAQRTLKYLYQCKRSWDSMYRGYLLTAVEMKDISLFLKKPKY